MASRGSPSPQINPIHPSRLNSRITLGDAAHDNGHNAYSPVPIPPSHAPAVLIEGETLTTKSPTGSIRQSQHSTIAKTVMSAPAMSRSTSSGGVPLHSVFLAPPQIGSKTGATGGGVGAALTDTPAATAPNSPRIRATTLDIPGLTKSRISPDGRISSRDIGAKLVIVMVGLPARGKSYVTKKIARYLNWLQHNTRIFNVGNRRRVAASMGDGEHSAGTPQASDAPSRLMVTGTGLLSAATMAGLLAQNGNGQAEHTSDHQEEHGGAGPMDQSSDFFDPNNVRAKQLREKVAMETLDELLHYILHEDGSVGILDATNSTIERRTAIVDHIRKVAGNELGIVFLESECTDQKLLEANMRLKLSGPDYKGMDPAKALEDFRKRVEIYERNYKPIGDYEERMGWQYIKMIDVGRKVVANQIKGFLSCQTVYYLLNFNLAPRQIWITRHGQSEDNVQGKIGGDASLTENGRKYAKALAAFIDEQRQIFDLRMQEKHVASLLPPTPGDTTPPNPEYTVPGFDPNMAPVPKNFCVWTSMLKRSVETSGYFNEEEYDIKQFRMLNELNAGTCEKLTYAQIRERYPEEYDARKKDKLHYRYPGGAGESYLDVINRLRTIIVEVERMTDHVLLIGHRVVARVLLAYFLGLPREDVTDLDVPLGMLFMLEPKPYGVGQKAYQYNTETNTFVEKPDWKFQREAVASW